MTHAMPGDLAGKTPMGILPNRFSSIGRSAQTFRKKRMKFYNLVRFLVD
jgi:hypothetical protein